MEEFKQKTTNEILNLKSINSSLNAPIGKQIKEHYGNILKLDWIFNKWYEKLLITASFLWGIYSIIKFLIVVF